MLSLLGLLFAFAAVYAVVRQRRSPRYPPGPKPLPILGNVKDLPKEKEALVYADWFRKYGDVFHVSALGSHLVFLNTSQAVQDIFVKRFLNYADRTPLHMINDLMGWDWAFGMMRYGDRWKEHRRMFDSRFKDSQISSYWPIIKQTTHALLKDLLDTPENLHEHLQFTSGSTIMKIMYGMDVKRVGDPYLSVASEAFRLLCEAASPGAYLVDTFPFLKSVPAWFPGAGFQRKAREWKKLTLRMRDAPFEATRKAMDAGIATPCFVSDVMNDLDASDSGKEKYDILRNCAGMGHAAGVESLSSGFSAFFLAMSLYPDSQRKAQQELDRVCVDRLPDFTDRTSLPYVSAIVNEILRWGTISPFGIPRTAIQDDEYNGYSIPAGTIVLGNFWAILHDESEYPEPFEFKPERYMSPDGTQCTGPDSAHYGYGAGRRKCAGRFIADAQLFITIASVLSLFDITPEPGSNLATKRSSYEELFTCRMESHPFPFKCSIKLRSGKSSALLESSQE